MPESERLRALDIIKSMPEFAWTQSVCTHSPVEQLADYFPLYVYSAINHVHKTTHREIEATFGVALDSPVLKKGAIIGVDRRTEGYYLPMHADVPTGTFAQHIGSKTGESKITVSCVFYWNDEFEGGEIHFEEDDFTYKPEAGDFVVFNSDIRHEVLEIKSGVRYSTQYFFERP